MNNIVFKYQFFIIIKIDNYIIDIDNIYKLFDNRQFNNKYNPIQWI